MFKVKKIFSTVLCLVLCLSFASINVSAADTNYSAGDIVEGTLLTDESGSIGYATPIARGTYLSDGTCSIYRGGLGIAKISASTICNRVCDSVEVYLYIDRLVNGTWVNIDSRSNSVSNGTKCTYSTSLAVSPGYYYRVRATHIVREAGIREMVSSNSNGIMID